MWYIYSSPEKIPLSPLTLPHPYFTLLTLLTLIIHPYPITHSLPHHPSLYHGVPTEKQLYLYRHTYRYTINKQSKTIIQTTIK
jgi:hypothetical protein